MLRTVCAMFPATSQPSVAGWSFPTAPVSSQTVAHTCSTGGGAGVDCANPMRTNQSCGEAGLYPTPSFPLVVSKFSLCHWWDSGLLDVFVTSTWLSGARVALET